MFSPVLLAWWSFSIEMPHIQNPINFRNSETFLSPTNPEALLQGTSEHLWL